MKEEDWQYLVFVLLAASVLIIFFVNGVLDGIKEKEVLLQEFCEEEGFYLQTDYSRRGYTQYYVECDYDSRYTVEIYNFKLCSEINKWGDCMAYETGLAVSRPDKHPYNNKSR